MEYIWKVKGFQWLFSFQNGVWWESWAVQHAQKVNFESENGKSQKVAVEGLLWGKSLRGCWQEEGQCVSLLPHEYIGMDMLILRRPRFHFLQLHVQMDISRNFPNAIMTPWSISTYSKEPSANELIYIFQYVLIGRYETHTSILKLKIYLFIGINII